VFDVPDESQIPPFIAVHIRRTDFSLPCPKDKPLSDCYVQLSSVVHRVEQVQNEISAMGLAPVTKVVVTSDEKNGTFWQEIADLGWKFVDHGKEETSKKYNKWYPTLIDGVIQSMGAGFVGTDRSTMSLISRRRVEDWTHGVTRIVKWGTPDADHDHTWRKRAIESSGDHPWFAWGDYQQSAR